MTVETVKGQSQRELRRRQELNQQMLDSVPRLQRDGIVQFGGLGTLAAQGWTSAEVNRVVDAFPAAPYLSLTMLVSLAGALREHGVPEVDDVIAWLRVMFESAPDGQLMPRKVIRDEVLHAHRPDGLGMPAVPALWTQAAGSAQAGLAALDAGLTLAETAAQNPG
jgi:hypothetical protein